MIALLYIPFCVFFAWLNAKWIADGKRIYHGINGAIHLIVAVLVGYFFGWRAGVAILFITRVFFDWGLNLFRGLPLGYVSLNPKSIVDRVEKALFKLNGILPKVIYLVIIVILMTWKKAG